MSYRITRRTDEAIEMINPSTGEIKLVPLASNEQWQFYESLRATYTNKAPLTHRPTVYAAKIGIKKLLDKKQKLEQQTKLF